MNPTNGWMRKNDPGEYRDPGVEKFVMANGTEDPWWGVANTIDPKATLEAWIETGGLDWRVCEMPAGAIGKTRTQVADDWKALVRSTDGKIFAFVSKDYRVHQNQQIVDVFRRFCESGELVMDTMGSLQGGRRVFANARVNGNIAIKTPKGTDWHVMYFIISTGHTGGYATQADLTDIRGVCRNTVNMIRQAGSNEECRWRLSHLATWTSAQAEAVQRLVKHALGKATTLKEEWEKLYAAPADRVVEAAYFSELYQPALYQEAVKRADSTITLGGYQVRTPSVERTEAQTRLVTLDSIVNDMQARKDIVSTILNPDRFNRTVTQLMTHGTVQPGVEMSAGTTANGVNAVTFWTDHDRGRNRESALDSAMFGQGKNEKMAAMDLALEYATAMQTVAGRMGR